MIFVSKDINARLKADALNIEVQDFEKQKINFDELFSGYREASISHNKYLKIIEGEKVEILSEEVLPNEFVYLNNK